MNPIAPSEVDALLARHAAPAATDTRPLAEAQGLVLRQDIRADRPFPPIHRVTMDGVAIRFAAWAAGRRTFRRQAIQAAGSPVQRLHDEDSCIEVMTGAPLPEETDTVVPVEQLAAPDDHVTIEGEVVAGQPIHRCGSDAPAGALLVPAGTRLTPGVVAAAAAVGLHHVRVAEWPRVAVVDTGSELVEVAATPAPHELRRSNAAALTALLAGVGVRTRPARRARDNAAELRAALAEAIESATVTVVTGGISRGRYDLVAPVLADLGVRLLCHGVRQNPGKPFAFGLGREGQVVFALPGNPVSALVCAARYVLPFLHRSLGEIAPPAQVRVDGAAPPRPGWTRFDLAHHRNEADGTARAALLPLNTSGDLRSLALAHGFVEVTDEPAPVRPWWWLR